MRHWIIAGAAALCSLSLSLSALAQTSPAPERRTPGGLPGVERLVLDDGAWGDVVWARRLTARLNGDGQVEPVEPVGDAEQIDPFWMRFSSPSASASENPAQNAPVALTRLFTDSPAPAVQTLYTDVSQGVDVSEQWRLADSGAWPRHVDLQEWMRGPRAVCGSGRGSINDDEIALWTLWRVAHPGSKCGNLLALEAEDAATGAPVWLLFRKNDMGRTSIPAVLARDRAVLAAFAPQISSGFDPAALGAFFAGQKFGVVDLRDPIALARAAGRISADAPGALFEARGFDGRGGGAPLAAAAAARDALMTYPGSREMISAPLTSAGDGAALALCGAAPKGAEERPGSPASAAMRALCAPGLLEAVAAPAMVMEAFAPRWPAPEGGPAPADRLSTAAAPAWLRDRLRSQAWRADYCCAARDPQTGVCAFGRVSRYEPLAQTRARACLPLAGAQPSESAPEAPSPQTPNSPPPDASLWENAALQDLFAPDCEDRVSSSETPASCPYDTRLDLTIASPHRRSCLGPRDANGRLVQLGVGGVGPRALTSDHIHGDLILLDQSTGRYLAQNETTTAAWAHFLTPSLENPDPGCDRLIDAEMTPWVTGDSGNVCALRRQTTVRAEDRETVERRFRAYQYFYQAVSRTVPEIDAPQRGSRLGLEAFFNRCMTPSNRSGLGEQDLRMCALRAFLTLRAVETYEAIYANQTNDAADERGATRDLEAEAAVARCKSEYRLSAPDADEAAADAHCGGAPSEENEEGEAVTLGLRPQGAVCAPGALPGRHDPAAPLCHTLKLYWNAAGAEGDDPAQGFWMQPMPMVSDADIRAYFSWLRGRDCAPWETGAFSLPVRADLQAASSAARLADQPDFKELARLAGSAAPDLMRLNMRAGAPERAFRDPGGRVAFKPGFDRKPVADGGEAYGVIYGALAGVRERVGLLTAPTETDAPAAASNPEEQEEAQAAPAPVYGHPVSAWRRRGFGGVRNYDWRTGGAFDAGPIRRDGEILGDPITGFRVVFTLVPPRQTCVQRRRRGGRGATRA